MKILFVILLILMFSIPSYSQTTHLNSLEGRATTTWVYRAFAQYTYNVYAVNDTTGADTLWVAPTADDTGRGRRVPILAGESQALHINAPGIWSKTSGGTVKYRFGGTN